MKGGPEFVRKACLPTRKLKSHIPVSMLLGHSLCQDQWNQHPAKLWLLLQFRVKIFNLHFPSHCVLTVRYDNSITYVTVSTYGKFLKFLWENSFFLVKTKVLWCSQVKSGIRSSTAVAVLIEMLNGERLQLICPASTTGGQLFDIMLREVNLPEPFLFGLTTVMGECIVSLC